VVGSAQSKLAWRRAGADVVITMPELADGERSFNGPLVVKLAGVQ
jgi:hypothetical protein